MQRISKFAGEMVKSSLGNEVYAPSEMMDHMLSSKEFYGPLEGMDPGAAGLGGCASLFTDLKTKKVFAA